MSANLPQKSDIKTSSNETESDLKTFLCLKIWKWCKVYCEPSTILSNFE